MKKSKRIFILVFIGVLLMVSSFESREIRAEEFVDIELEEIGYRYMMESYDTGFIGYGKVKKPINMYDENIAFCIDPYKTYSNEKFIMRDDIDEIIIEFKEGKINKKVSIDYINKIIYHGWDNSEHSDNDYALTQLAIWDYIYEETIGSYRVFEPYKSIEWDIEDVRNIQKKANMHDEKPEVYYNDEKIDGKLIKVRDNEVFVIEVKNINEEYLIEQLMDIDIKGLELSYYGSGFILGQIDQDYVDGNAIALDKWDGLEGDFNIFIPIDNKQKMMSRGDVPNYKTEFKIDRLIEYGGFKIIKKDENGKSLSGMIFNLYDENGVFVESLITNTRGEAKSSKLPYGKYIIEEVYQEGFIPLESFEFVIDKDSVETINIVNKYANGQVSIRKIDSVSKGPIAKVKFGIYRQEDQMLMETITTNSQGLATSKKLDFGFYYLKEIDSPAIYEDNPNTYSFEISEASKNVEMQIENTKKEGEIVPPEGPKKLRIVKKDLETNEVLADVSFGIYNSKGELIETVKTDKNGIAITSKKLNNIVYTIKEEISPKGYYPIENIKVRLDEPSFVETKGNEKIYEQVIANKKTSFRITKTDDKGNILSGAKLRLVDSTGKEVVKDWISDQKPHELRGLEVGKKYILQELEAVDGYIKVDDQELIVKSDKENELYLVNETIKTKIIKLDEKTNQPLKDVVFNLETAEGEKLKFKKTKAIYTRDEEGQEELKTDKNGEIVLETLETGKFYLVEKSPNEYYENIGRVEIIVAEKDMVNPVIIRNDRINKFGKLIINKKDAYTYEPIKDVEIRILDEDKTELGIYATDDAGQISVELPYGKYFYQELKVDKRYRLDSREHEVSVDKEVVEKEFLNESTFLKIIKENKEKERLKGVKFNILDENDKVLLFTYEEDKDLYISDQYGEIEGLVTNEEGEIVVLRLDKGSYKIEEKESLPGYVMEEMPKEIALEDKQEVTIVNKKMSDIENVPGKKKDPPKKEDPKGPPPPPGGSGSQGSINTSQGKSQGMTTPKTGDKSILNYLVSLTISTFVLASTKRRSK